MVINDELSGWWFGTWLLFSPIAGMRINSKIILFRGIETTNQLS